MIPALILQYDKSPRRAVKVTSTVLLMLLACCSSGGDTDGRVVVDTLENGTALVSNSVAGIWTPDEAWRAVVGTRIGSVDGLDTAKVFGSVWDVTVDEYGRIYVLDQQAFNVRVFEWNGEYVRTLGRQGGGPGELQRPIGLDWGPDGNLWIVDQSNARYTVYDTAGSYVTSHARQIGGWGYGWGGGFDRLGNLYEPSYYGDRESGESMRVYIRHVLGDALVAQDSFDLPSYEGEDSYRMDGADGSTTFVSIPFAPSMTWRFDRADGLWFSVGETYRLYHRTLGGDTTHIVELEYEPVSVTPADLDGVRERYAEYGEQHVNRLIEIMPSVKPAIRSLVVDDRGYVWVFRTMPAGADSAGTALDVFDPQGRYLGAVTAEISTNPPPEIIGNRMVGVTYDELDVAYVVAYRITGR